MVATTPNRNLIVAAVQLTSTADIAANLKQCIRWLQVAVDGGAELVVFPENFSLMGSEPAKLPHAAALEASALLAPLIEAARASGVWVVAGGVPEASADPARCYNTSVLIDPQGSIKARYRKIHLFDVDLADGFSVRESAIVAPGDAVVTADVLGWRLGFSVCYDLRFPELYRQAVAAGAHILCVPAAFTLHTGKDHWDTLLRARAIENQCYVIAAAQFGHHGGKLECWGKSQIIDPWGSLLATSPERPGVVLATLMAEDLVRVRSQVPCLNHRVL